MPRELREQLGGVPPSPVPPAPPRCLDPGLAHLAGVFACGRNLPLLIGLRQQWTASSPQPPDASTLVVRSSPHESRQ